MISRAALSPVARGATLVVALLSIAGIAISLAGILSLQAKTASLAELSRAAQAYLSSMKDMETSYRAYVIVPSSDFLEPLNEASQRFPTQEAELKSAAANAGTGQTEVEQLVASSGRLQRYSQQLLEARKLSFDAAQALVSRRIGKEVMDGARVTAEKIDAAVRDRTAQLNKRVWQFYVPIAIVSALSMLLSSVLLGVFAWKARRLTIRARELLGKVMERAPVGLALLDRSRQIVSMNAAFASMIRSKARPGAGLAEFSPTLASHIDRTLSGGSGSLRQTSEEAAETVIDVDFGDATKAFKFEVFPITLADGEGRMQRGAGLVLADITQQREWEADLQAARDAAEGANRAKSAFIANMSHELRTPLTAVLGYCELVEEDLKELGQDRILSDLNKISLNAKHLLGLINDVLDLSKIEAQKMDVHAVDISASALVKEIEAATGSLVSKKNNTLSLIAEPDFQMHTDDLKLKQILLNLISNSAKFTENGSIKLTARLVDSKDEAGGPLAVFEVADSGMGMTEEQVTGLFQRFVQADATTTRKFGGTGLGLALTRALATMLGGSIEVKSEVGKGSVFTLAVPAHYRPREVDLEAIEAAEAPQPAIVAASQPEKAAVLVVDDNPSARDLLSRHLASEGFSVLTAATGTEALELLKSHRPVAVLLDIMMPGMDGWHVLKAIRANPDTEKLPVIMQTVLDDTRVAYALGANSYLKKPVRRADLAEALRSAVLTSPDKRILIVDDDMEASRRLKVMLKRDGWSVDLAANGADGIQRMQEHRFDLVLVDLVMPEMDGYALVREIRRHSQFDEIPVVVMTAQDINSAKVRKLRKSTSGIVQKGSMPLSDLVADLRSIAGGSQAEPSTQSQGAS